MNLEEEDEDSRLSLSRLFDPAVLADPYPLYRELQNVDPVHWDIFLQAWVVTGYEDSVRVLRSFSAVRTPTEEQLEEMGLSAMSVVAGLTNKQMLFLDPPQHTRIRSLVASAFTPRSVVLLRNRIESLADELIAAKLNDGEMDVVADFADKLPGYVTAAMLGVPKDDHGKLRTWAMDFSEAFGSFQSQPERGPAIAQSCRDMSDYFRDCVRRMGRNEEGIVSALMKAEIEGDRLTEEEVIANCVVIMVGGLETSASLIANGFRLLLPVFQKTNGLLSDSDRMVSAVEEVLRYDSPVQHTARVAINDVELRGKHIRQGQPVIVVLAAANRDEDRFLNPDDLEVTRADNRHLSFGWATHFCLGAQLARLEAQVAMRKLLALPNVHLKPGQLDWRMHLGLRSLRSLNISFSR